MYGRAACAGNLTLRHSSMPCWLKFAVHLAAPNIFLPATKTQGVSARKMILDKLMTQLEGMIRKNGSIAPDGLPASQDNITGSTQLLKMTHAYVLALHGYQ